LRAESKFIKFEVLKRGIVLDKQSDAFDQMREIECERIGLDDRELIKSQNIMSLRFV